eukprot:COSAG01_NODE_61544_length_289_cov_0.547368_1_plen_59_part_01
MPRKLVVPTPHPAPHPPESHPDAPQGGTSPRSPSCTRLHPPSPPPPLSLFPYLLARIAL